MSEWQPGDVAMVSGADGVERLAMWTGHATNGPGWLIPFVGYWDFHYSFQVDPRPLAVIDPEDRAQVERLCVGIVGHNGVSWVDATQAALREFANPTPPIEEPSSLYAVVEDRGGDQWCHIGERVWRSLTSTGQFMVEKHWHDAGTPLAGNVVRVLSEGVTDV